MAQDSGKSLATNPRKRKDPPAPQKVKFANNKKQKIDHRSRLRDARALSTQTTGNAFQRGELDVDKFVKAREYEIRALEQGMQRSRKALNQRAFQQVPRELRRRTASHDAKRVPKRLRATAKKEMIQDQTPTVNSRTRKLTGHQRLRIETAKKLRALGARKKQNEKETDTDKMDGVGQTKTAAAANSESEVTTIHTRPPRLKKSALAKPPVPKAKFRKRQLNKSWLPTHIFHAKRAHMTLPKSPLWRFAIPLTPTQKSYRTMHRAARERGAVAWDTSYMSTISLYGQLKSIEGMLRALGVSIDNESLDIQKWRQGSQVIETLVYEREAPHLMIAPVTIICCAELAESAVGPAEHIKQKRKAFLRVHPSAFHQLWEEIIRLSKVAKPSVGVEDLRYEIGSIEMTGPGSTETLLGALWSYEYSSPAHGETRKDNPIGNVAVNTWASLAGITNPSALPANALLAFEAQDPRLHHPPRTISLPATDPEQHKLLEALAAWPIHGNQSPSALFNRDSRLRASRLPSQKSINRRKSLALPGDVLQPTSADPRIPLMLYVSTNIDRSKQSSWTLLLPWKCVQPFWYSIIFYPLSTGQQPRFAGLHQKRQLAFENGQPWFPADFPGSQAGWEWEVNERQVRRDEWARKPKAKRISWEKVNLGGGRKGEVGEGWSCHWELLFYPADAAPRPHNVDALSSIRGDATTAATTNGDTGNIVDAEKTSTKQEAQRDTSGQTQQTSNAKAVETPTKPPSKPQQLEQLSAAQAHQHLRKPLADMPPGALATVSITAVTRGVPQTCARIYRLPSEAAERQRWLDLLPSRQSACSKKKKSALPPVNKNMPAHEIRRQLAQSLIEPSVPGGESTYIPCPGIEDLVGFVTSGNFNLAEGKGVGVGCVALARAAQGLRSARDEGGLCIVRNAGESVSRLARWKIV